MIHFLLRIAVWAVVLVVGYLLIGPGLFDSSPRSPFESNAEIFLPPARSPRLVELEAISGGRGLTAEESAEYQGLVRERASTFWRQDGVTVEAALAGIKRQRRDHLARILSERGLSDQEAAIFYVVIERDHPGLLADRD